jgi:hypothetical protein
MMEQQYIIALEYDITANLWVATLDGSSIQETGLTRKEALENLVDAIVAKEIFA